jgi:solute carrier family 25 carnitine/acylcarnitine transporter 20/29
MIGGFVGTVFSHPFDTIKTRIQSGKARNFKQALSLTPTNQYKGTLTPLHKLFAICPFLTVRDLYRGVSAPLFGIGFEKLIVFGFYGECKKLGFGDGFSGLVGGFASTLVVVPVDRIKIIMQNKEAVTRNCFSLSSLYKGFSITLFRETPGFGIYFTTYNKLANNFNQEKNLFKSFVFGSASGLTSWVFIYPSDLIKTKYQAIQNNSNITICQVIKNIYLQDGPKGFYRGFSFAIMRALPLHGGVFLGYEYSKKIFF